MNDNTNAFLRQVACEQIIIKAAKIYCADLDPSRDYGAYLIMGSDEILCRPDESIATPEEKLQYRKWQWLQQSVSPSDITLVGCIRYVCLDIEEEDEDEDDDCVSFEQVLRVLNGRQPN